MHADRHTSRGVYTMFWTLTIRMKPYTYIIAEAGVNHNGRLDLALQLCDAAKKAGVDAVKFQTWKTELIVSKETDMAEYQKENIGIN